MMHTILLFMPYFGKMPNYFDIWLRAAANNPTIDFCLITDLIKDKSVLPRNVKVKDLTFDEFKRTAQEKFDFNISIKNYGRISQFRPALAYIFPELVTGYDYWGFIECDLIPGNIRKFLNDDLLQRYDKFFKLGHFQVFRNCNEMNSLFMRKSKKALDYKFAFSKDILFFEELLGMHNIAESFNYKTYSENVFTDIKANKYMFETSTYGYDEQCSNKCIISYNNGNLVEHFLKDDGTIGQREVLYVHLQKRNMSIRTSNEDDQYVIIPNEFIKYREITTEFFNNVIKQCSLQEPAYETNMNKVFSCARKKRYRELCWWRLILIRKRITRNGGVDLDGR